MSDTTILRSIMLFIKESINFEHYFLVYTFHISVLAT